MQSGIRWTVRDKHGNSIYITQERREHITEPTNHPEMVDNGEELKETIRSGKRIQDPLNPQKYCYSMAFDNLAKHNTHIIAIVLFRFREQAGEVVPNNHIVIAYQKEIR
ncbi:MAG: hypothetical protein AB1345_11185 [Chloroflexota bacterium]